MARIKLGAKVRDKYTGFHGIAAVRMTSVTGYSQLRIDRMNVDGSLEMQWLEEKACVGLDDAGNTIEPIVATSGQPTSADQASGE